jgi:hypothetical protein
MEKDNTLKDNNINASHNHIQPCPHCGYCPTCGRPYGTQPYYPPWPNPYMPWYGGGAIC